MMAYAPIDDEGAADHDNIRPSAGFRRRKSVEGLRAGTKVGCGVFGARREGIPATLVCPYPRLSRGFFGNCDSASRLSPAVQTERQGNGSTGSIAKAISAQLPCQSGPT